MNTDRFTEAIYEMAQLAHDNGIRAERAEQEVERLRTILRAVKADRSSAHSDAVWTAINEALRDR